MPLILPPSGVTATGLLKWEWLDPTGVLRDLTMATSPSLFVSRGTAGLGSPPVDMVMDKLPFAPGSIPRYIQTGAVEIDLPIHARASTFAALLSTVQGLRRWFDTGNERQIAPGYLRITRPSDDAVRQIACLYNGGLEGDLAEGGPNATQLVVSLIAPDPYWTDTADTTATYATPGSYGVVNPGDFDAYPVWTITGPFSNLSIQNTTAGKGWSLSAGTGLTLVAGDTLTVDTRPSWLRETVQIYNQAGTSFFAKLATGAAGGSLWWLLPGSNNFTIAASGTGGLTSFSLAYLPRYRGVLR